MVIKKLFPAALATAVLAGAGAANAEMEISGNAALTSDYKFGGIAQSAGSVALQGDFDVAFGSGFYMGTWGSSVDFDTNGGGLDDSLLFSVGMSM